MMLVMVSVSGTAVASQSHVLGYLLIIKNFSLLQMRTEVDYAQTRLSIANVFNEFRQGRFVYLLASECLIERTFCCHKISTQGFGRSLHLSKNDFRLLPLTGCERKLIAELKHMRGTGVPV